MINYETFEAYAENEEVFLYVSNDFHMQLTTEQALDIYDDGNYNVIEEIEGIVIKIK